MLLFQLELNPTSNLECKVSVCGFSCTLSSRVPLFPKMKVILVHCQIIMGHKVIVLHNIMELFSRVLCGIGPVRQ